MKRMAHFLWSKNSTTLAIAGVLLYVSAVVCHSFATSPSRGEDGESDQQLTKLKEKVA